MDVDEGPPGESMLDRVNEGEATTITKVIAGSDVKEKDNAVIVAAESVTRIMIIYDKGMRGLLGAALAGQRARHPCLQNFGHEH